MLPLPPKGKCWYFKYLFNMWIVDTACEKLFWEERKPPKLLRFLCPRLLSAPAGCHESPQQACPCPKAESSTPSSGLIFSCSDLLLLDPEIEGRAVSRSLVAKVPALLQGWGQAASARTGVNQADSSPEWLCTKTGNLILNYFSPVGDICTVRCKILVSLITCLL